MKNKLVRIGLIFGIIILFISVGIHPVFASKQKECFDVENHYVTIELCGLGKEYTFQLTEQQLNKIDVLFESIREDLDIVKTKEDSIRIFNDMILELDSYGFLIDSCIKQVQGLIFGNYLKFSNNHFLNKWYENKQLSGKNILCLICGHSTETSFLPASSSLLIRLSFIFESYYLAIVAYMAAIFRYGIQDYFKQNPIALGSSIIFGAYYYGLGGGFVPARGWIFTLGLFGVKRWNGEFYGQISELMAGNDLHYIGATGFIGIKIWKNNLDYYYMGFANSIYLRDNSHNEV